MNEFYGTEDDAVAAPISMMTDDEAYILMAAVRYQLPRRTYGSAVVCSYIERNMHRIHQRDIDMIIRDIQKSIDRNEVSAIDSTEWNRILHILEDRRN